MIGKLRGRVDSSDNDSLIIDVGGVGYHVFCSERTVASLALGDYCELVIETNVREDHIHLYGFPDNIERSWFRLLVSVQGVGNKIALAILGAYHPEKLAHAIIAKDIAAFKIISGIGAKLAERIITELKDKAPKLATDGKHDKLLNNSLNKSENSENNKSAAKKISPTTTEDSISALVNFGYSRSDSYAATLKALEKMETLGEQVELGSLIRLSLKEVARK